MYCSILLLLFSFITAIILAVYNHFFVPELETFRKIVAIILFVFTGVFLFWPLRYLFSALCTRYYSLSRLAKYLKIYDDGRLKEAVGLSNKHLELWAQNKVLTGVYHRIPEFKNKFNTKLPISLGIWASVILILVIVLSPKELLTEGKSEIINGVFSREVHDFTVLDTIHVPYNKTVDLNEPGLYSVHNGTRKSMLLIKTNESVEWNRNGRYFKTQTIICDSIPRLTSWRASIHPPEYLGLSPYDTQDTIKAFEGSQISINYQGVLKNKIKVVVSRETNSSVFVWQGGFIELSSNYWSRSIPTVVLKDKPPVISVLSNTNDSLVFSVSDDYGLQALSINTKNIAIEGLGKVLGIAWNKNNDVLITARDINNGRTKRVIQRPKLTSGQLLTVAYNEALKSTVSKNKESELKEYRTRKEVLEEKLNKSVTKEVVPKKSGGLDSKEPEPLEKLLEELEKLWKIEEALELLSRVDTAQNKELDSALTSAAESLDDLGLKEASESSDLMKSIEEQGEDRKQQAKEASAKLKELLANSTADVQEDNVARIKRLLKNGWVVSVFQEGLLELSTAVNKARSQQVILANETAIKDSLDLLLIHEPKLGQLLTEKRVNLDGAMRSMEAKISKGKSTDADAGYVITALNDINQTLYFLLESEKANLNAAKKNCKNGKPGKTGKPSSSGKGQEGKKGVKPGKKPGGRAKGSTGDPKNGKEGTKPGSSGRPNEKELLKRIEAAKALLIKEGESSARGSDELDRMLKELLFTSEKSNEDLNELEDRLWRVEQSVFTKKELGEKRDSESGVNSRSEQGKTILYKVLQSKETDLPLPVLKKR